jgi:phosphoenolpyruvate---glycerone phosphotransferase subunit DhaL
MDDGATLAELRTWVRTFATLIEENRDLLTELDAAIGDADHGANMARGMSAAVAVLDEPGLDTPAALFKKVGMTLVSTVGGASGPLYGTFFLRVGGALGETDPVTADTVTTALRAGLEGVVARGKAEAGDKSM